MADRATIRRAISEAIDDLDMMATMRKCHDVVSRHVVVARQRMRDADEPEALRALLTGTRALADADPWKEKTGL